MAGLDRPRHFASACVSNPESIAAVDFHVADGQRDLLWLQVAHLLACQGSTCPS